ncbi:MAG: ThuA domain-containing protein [Lachnospiraceae bacterium]|nr:ThuA domain-containing protein [Lachnospiraceae bacterium]
MSSSDRIRVTFWYEYTQESGYLRRDRVAPDISDEDFANFEKSVREKSVRIHEVYPEGQMEALAGYLRKNEAFEVRTATLYDEGYGLTDEILDNTDVLIYWGHASHAIVPDEAVIRIQKRVWMGMGFICLHSGHHSKTFTRIVGGSGTLHWREDEFCRIWTLAPTHPIAQGIPASFDLEEEEMYCEPFDVPKPDDLIFASWYRSGELFRSGMTWTRGYGKIFYFQPGHETSPSYKNRYVLKIIENAVFWARPTVWREDLNCVQDVVSAEERYKNGNDN